ncbi:MAG: hypothetical protein M1320_01375 [Patescibacteria group bacterium]|nr:hypothetical protein [Patescibacteria group bacterium]
MSDKIFVQIVETEENIDTIPIIDLRNHKSSKKKIEDIASHYRQANIFEKVTSAPSNLDLSPDVQKHAAGTVVKRSGFKIFTLYRQQDHAPILHAPTT